VGLLIVLGTILGGSEGLKCYQSEGPDIKNSRECPWGYTSCVKFLDGGTVTGRLCGSGVGQTCFKNKYPSGCAKLTTEEEGKNFAKCITAGRSDQTTTKNTTEDSLGNLRTILDGQTSRQGLQNIRADEFCYCWTDNCNPAGHSTPNNRVIFAILVAAALYSFNFGLGSF